MGGLENRPIRPVKIEGRCAHCRCGERVEIPDIEGAVEAAKRGNAKVHRIRCPNCIALLEVRDPYKIRKT